MTNKTITLARDHVERLIARLSKAQMFKEVTELRAALAEPVPPAGEAQQVHTDCRSEEGITVGLVDTIINCARLLKIRPTTSAVEQALQDLRADADVAALVAAPVPPAGGEPLRYHMHSYVRNTSSWGEPCKVAEVTPKPKDDGEWVKYEDHRAHVTRLQADVERLQDQLAIDRKNEQTKLCTELNSLQSELTKARELLYSRLLYAVALICRARDEIYRNPQSFWQVLNGVAEKVHPTVEDAQQLSITPPSHSRAEPVPPADKGQVNPEHTLFNEIRISEPVNEDGEPTRYLITEAQLQRIRAMETDKGQGEPVAWRITTPGGVVYSTKYPAWSVFEGATIEPLYAEQPAPVAVVMPERIKRRPENPAARIAYIKGWNACHDEVASLNGVKS